jgi:hypothetical protein
MAKGSISSKGEDANRKAALRELLCRSDGVQLRSTGIEIVEKESETQTRS